MKFGKKFKSNMQRKAAANKVVVLPKVERAPKPRKIDNQKQVRDEIRRLERRKRRLARGHVELDVRPHVSQYQSRRKGNAVIVSTYRQNDI